MSEYENLLSRERKRRNKEKRAARIATLSVFTGQSPLSLLHPSMGHSLPTSSLQHHSDLHSTRFDPVYLPSVHQSGSQVRSTGEDIVAPRPRSKTMGMPAPPVSMYPIFYPTSQQQTTKSSSEAGGASSSSSPPPLHYSRPDNNPACVDSDSFPSTVQAHLFDGDSSSSSPFDMVVVHSEGKPPSASKSEFDFSSVPISQTHLSVPTSAHVRPVDLPAPHGHFDFASVPFPSQGSFNTEADVSVYRRRSSAQGALELAGHIRRPSVAEMATVSLMDKLMRKRAETPFEQGWTERTSGAIGATLLTSSQGWSMNAWNANESQLWNESFSLESTLSSTEQVSGLVGMSLPQELVQAAVNVIDQPGFASGSQAVPPYLPNEGDLSGSFNSWNRREASGDSSNYYPDVTSNTTSPWSQGSDSTPNNLPGSDSVPQQNDGGWTHLQGNASLLSPVTELNMTFERMSGFATSSQPVPDAAQSIGYLENANPNHASHPGPMS